MGELNRWGLQVQVEAKNMTHALLSQKIPGFRDRPMWDKTRPDTKVLAESKRN